MRRDKCDDCNDCAAIERQIGMAPYVLDLTSLADSTMFLFQPTADTDGIAFKPALGFNPWVSIDPLGGAPAGWIHDAKGWHWLRSGAPVKLYGDEFRFALSGIGGLQRKALLYFAQAKSALPDAIVHPLIARGPANANLLVADTITLIASGTISGDPKDHNTNPGISVAVPDDGLYCTIYDAAGAREAWVSFGATDAYRLEFSGRPFPVRGNTMYVRQSRGDLTSRVALVFTPVPVDLPRTNHAYIDATLAASGGALLNAVTFLYTGLRSSYINSTVVKSTGVGTMILEYVMDAGDGTAPVVTNTVTAATTGTHQYLITAMSGITLQSLRLGTFGGNVYIYCNRI